MSVFEAIEKRYSCRKYQDRPIEQELLDRIFAAGRLAPSAHNTQDWRFVVVTDKKVRYEVARSMTRPRLFRRAAAIIVACSTSDAVMTCGQAIGPIDITIALDHISLMATELGLATCWLGSFLPDKVRPVLGIPDDVAIIELMAVGYAADEPRQANRLPVEKIVCYNKWRF